MTRIRNVRNATKLKRSIKAISPVIATLLMIAIAVVASLVVYAWVMGYMNFTTEKTGKAIQIQSVSYNPTGNVFTIYVQNVGDSPIQFPTTSPTNIFINGAVATSILGNVATLEKGSTVELSGTMASLTAGVQQVTIKVTSSDGTFSQITKQFNIGSGGPTPTPGPTATPTPTPGPTATPTPTPTPTPVTITLRPNAAGTTTQLTPNSGSNYQCVDDTSPDTSSRVYTTSSTLSFDTYALENSGLSTGTITQITVHVVALVEGGSGTAKEYIRIGGTNYNNPGSHTLTNSYVDYSYSWATNPNTSAAWTWANIDALEAGVGLTQSGGNSWDEARCTQVYVVVTYTP